ncbi:MAG: hypothetical protein LC797_13580 [Chloroflexi bacterium]|nr:hypothetical protein [Chloroflexota bacterium]
MTSSEPDDKSKTRPIELPTPAPPPPAQPEPAPEFEPAEVEPPTAPTAVAEPVTMSARPASSHERETLFVPLAVNVGDGFKFGCGFFLALVLVMLIGFVMVAALFALTSLFGLNLPITR